MVRSRRRPLGVRPSLLFPLALAALALGACAHRAPVVERPAPEPSAPEPRREPPGPAPSRTEALEKIADPARWPSLDAAFQGRDGGLLNAVDRSLAWFGVAAKRSPYPFQPLGLSHERARAGVAAFREHLLKSQSPAEFRERMARDFDLYASVGSDGRGSVLFTGYYSPVFRASRTRTDEYRYPLYGRPPDLVMDKGGDRVLGRSVGGKVVPYPSRSEIEKDPGRLGLKGRELAWLASKLDVYLLQVQGSARLEMADGGPPLYVGHGGSNGREYVGLGKLLVADGKLPKGRAGIPAIRAYFQDHPDELDAYLNRNERFVFFAEIPAARWPSGSMGIQVSALRTVASDKTIFPRGGVVLVQTTITAGDGSRRPFDQFMLDQDAGGGILAPGRIDLYTGIGDEAGEIAGRQTFPGRLYYFVLKPERTALWAKAER